MGSPSRKRRCSSSHTHSPGGLVDSLVRGTSGLKQGLTPTPKGHGHALVVGVGGVPRGHRPASWGLRWREEVGR